MPTAKGQEPTAKSVPEETYRRLALGNRQLERHRGELREKPGMSVEHNDVMMHLGLQTLAHRHGIPEKERADITASGGIASLEPSPTRPHSRTTPGRAK